MSISPTAQRILDALEGKTWGDQASNVERLVIAPLLARNDDLLAALKEATEALAHVSWSNVPYDPSNEQCKRAYQRGLNAIAKAEEGS